MKQRNPFIIAVAVALILVFGSLLFVFQVRQSEVAVVTTFEKISGAPITQPGAHFQLPWPIQRVVKLDQRIQSFESKYEEVQLADQNILMMAVYVGWRINDPGVFFRGFPSGRASEAEKSLGDCIQTAKNEVLSKHNLSDLISAEEQNLKFAQIEAEFLQRARDQVGHQKYGVEITFVHIKKIGLPESVTAKVFARMESERQILIKQIQSQGEAQAILTKAQADSEAASILAQAEAEAVKIRGEGETKAAEALGEFRKSPELALFNMRLQALEQMLKQNTTLVLDQSTPPLDLLVKGLGASTNNPDAAKK
jgi:modulator of FtsH protease HflC